MIGGAVVLAIVLVVLSYSTLVNEDDEIIDHMYGEVLEDFSTAGIVNGSEHYDDEFAVLWIYEGDVRIRMWNLSSVRLGTMENGTVAYEEYPLDHAPVFLIGTKCYLEYRIRSGTMEFNLSDFHGREKAGIFNFYMNFSSFSFNGSLMKSEIYEYDVLVQDMAVVIGNRIITDSMVQMQFDVDETPMIHMDASGSGNIYPMPDFHINGTFMVDGFKETSWSGLKKRTHDTISFSSTSIVIHTIKMPDTDYVHGDYVLAQPWFIEIRVEDG